MFSPNASESNKLIEICFLIGLKKSTVLDNLNNQESTTLPATEIIFSYPRNNDIVTPSILEFVFPDGLNFSFNEEMPKIYSVVLTNEKGVRSYVYVLKYYERISQNSLNENINSSNANEDCRISNVLPRNSSTSTSEKFIYLPISICIWSSVSNLEFFKKILQELYEILNLKIYDCQSIVENPQANLNLNTIRDYQNLEIVNYFIFLSNMIKPPINSRLTLNLRLSQPQICFPSVNELPTSDFYYNLLFNSLEISVIIKLWVSLLTEKHVIILANQNILLFSICEALLSLIFPFKWLHTYIPVLPCNELDYLESPTPYIMGVNSNYTDYQYLKELFPNHVICDVNTSQIFGNSITNLPALDEVKLRKKLLYIKNPDMYNIEVFNKVVLSELKTFNIEDVNPARTPFQNIHFSFFRIFRTYLGNLRKYIINRIFDSHKFLEDFVNEEYREFWGKIINTVAFEYFILSDQYLDDSNLILFENIIKFQQEEEDKNLYKLSTFNYNINLSDDMQDMINELISNTRKNIKASELSIEEYIEKCMALKISYVEYMSIIKKTGGDNKLSIQANNTETELKLATNNKLDFIVSAKFYTPNENYFLKFLNEIFYVLNNKDSLDIGLFLKNKRNAEIEQLINLNDYTTNKTKNNNYVYFKDLNKSDCAQFNLIVAFHLEEQLHLKELCFEYYTKSCQIDKRNFPRIRFYQFLNLFDNKGLKNLINICNNKLMLKIIECRIKKISKKKLKKLVIDPEEFFKKEHSGLDDFFTESRSNSNDKIDEDLLNSFRSKKSTCIIEVPEQKMRMVSVKQEECKSKEKIMKFNIINNYFNTYNIDKDPISLSEEISIKLFTFITKNSLDKYKTEMFSPKLFNDLQKSSQFYEIKNLIAILQKINLNKIYSNKCKVCFWLNTFNFLLIFTLIFKKDVLSNYYEWYRFLKNSYYNIGGYEISLYEIQNVILTGGKFSHYMYGENITLDSDDPKTSLQFENNEKFLTFGIFFPTKSSPALRVFFPSTLSNQLKNNANEYISKNVNIDLDYNILSVSEYIMWSDDKFKDNLEYYKEILCEEFLNFVQENKNKLSQVAVKYTWSIDFSNFNKSEFYFNC